jgi:hypothetical protein
MYIKSDNREEIERKSINALKIESLTDLDKNKKKRNAKQMIE